MTRLDWLAVKEIVAMAEACNWVYESELLSINAWESDPTDCCSVRQLVAFVMPESILYVVVEWETASGVAAS